MLIGVLPGRWHIKETDICQLYPVASLLVNTEHRGALGFPTQSNYTQSVDSVQPESFTLLEDSLLITSMLFLLVYQQDHLITNSHLSSQTLNLVLLRVTAYKKNWLMGVGAQ